MYVKIQGPWSEYEKCLLLAMKDCYMLRDVYAYFGCCQVLYTKVVDETLNEVFLVDIFLV